MARDFTIVVERGEDGYLVASVPSLSGCHTQARSMEKRLERAKEAIELCREALSPKQSLQLLPIEANNDVAVDFRDRCRHVAEVF